MGSNERLWLLFCGLCAIIAMALAPRLWALRSLYLDAETRMNTRTILETVAEREGWLISDISLRSVEADALIVVHRAHMRGQDPEQCYRLLLTTAKLLPCDA